jgi:glycosyltransferase involved in cell wall biosynthesis
MRIAYIAAGAAGMYCGSCLHDNTLAAALLDLGEDIVLVPTYTPLRTDEANVSVDRIFFGGINVYLQQKLALFRRTPWWLDRLFDQPALLERATRGASAVDARQLGDMTVSMLRGEDGHQRKELEKLAHWLRTEVQPDIIHLSNALQLGMARLLRTSCDRPLVCQLSGEDLFLERLPPPFHDEAREIMRKRAADADAFVAINHYYANHMVEYLAVDPSRVHVIPHGVRLEGHGGRLKKPADEPRVVGYFARICEDKGLHLLVEAGEHLARRADLPPFVVHAAGYLGAGDRAYLQQLELRSRGGPLASRFQYLGELDRRQKIDFLQSLDVFSVPTVYRESKGLPALEALANAVPVVLPDHGSFSELVADTGGGLLCRPHDSTDLADKLAELLSDSPRAAQLGLAGQKAIQDRYHAAAMSRHTRDLYSRLIEGAALGS